MRDLKVVALNPQEQWRWDTMRTKEPGTVRWIEAQVHPGDTFYDIGANVGVYTLLAAQLIGEGRVYAFEPHVPTAKSLLTNVSLNECGKVVTVLTCALHRTAGFFPFNYRKMVSGSSGHQLGHTTGEYGEPFEPTATELKYATTLRFLVSRHLIEPPTLIKLDVDGNELEILRGMGSVILDPRLRSLQVEVHPRDDVPVIHFMQESGFTVAEHHYTDLGQQARDQGVPDAQIAHNVVFQRV